MKTNLVCFLKSIDSISQFKNTFASASSFCLKFQPPSLVLLYPFLLIFLACLYEHTGYSAYLSCLLFIPSGRISPMSRLICCVLYQTAFSGLEKSLSEYQWPKGVSTGKKGHACSSHWPPAQSCGQFAPSCPGLSTPPTGCLLTLAYAHAPPYSLS